MINRSYTYQHQDLWAAEAWEDRRSPVAPLALWIEERNHELIRDRAALHLFDDRTDGTYVAKNNSVIYDDVVSGWHERGLEFLCDEMAGTGWILLTPTQTPGPSAKILLVLHDADMSDPRWAMNTLEYYRDYNELATAQGFLVLYVVTDGVDESALYASILQEIAVRFRRNPDQILLDLSRVDESGTSLTDLPGFVYRDRSGAVIDRPDGQVENFYGIPVLDVAGRLHDRVSHLYDSAMSPRFGHPAFDVERLIHNAAGRSIAEAMVIEHDYDDALDPELLAFWQAKGVRYETHDQQGQQWVSLTPLTMDDGSNGPLPVLLVFKEVTYLNPFQPLAALSSYYEWADLVAQGELMVIFFTLESPEDNDLYVDILQDAAASYPIDFSRVYATGHSHNGNFAMEFMRRHPDIVAAVATLGNEQGLPAPAYAHEQLVDLTDDVIDYMSTIDTPVININGITEMHITNRSPESQDYADEVESWQRRLKASNCPPKTFTEIAAARTSTDLVTRVLGIPSDRTEVQYRLGSECYIADIRNNDGAWHLRVVALENFLHMNAPQMTALSWDFLRRFARDRESGRIVELY